MARRPPVRRSRGGAGVGPLHVAPAAPVLLALAPLAAAHQALAGDDSAQRGRAGARGLRQAVGLLPAGGGQPERHRVGAVCALLGHLPGQLARADHRPAGHAAAGRDAQVVEPLPATRRLGRDAHGAAPGGAQRDRRRVVPVEAHLGAGVGVLRAQADLIVRRRRRSEPLGDRAAVTRIHAHLAPGALTLGDHRHQHTARAAHQLPCAPLATAGRRRLLRTPAAARDQRDQREPAANPPVPEHRSPAGLGTAGLGSRPYPPTRPRGENAAEALAKPTRAHCADDSNRGPHVPVSHPCYSGVVAREISQRQLRNESGEVMRALDAGQSFLVTRNGVAVGELTPVRRHRYVGRDAALAAFSHAAPIAAAQFRADIDRLADQDPGPRG